MNFKGTKMIDKALLVLSLVLVMVAANVSSVEARGKAAIYPYQENLSVISVVNPVGAKMVVSIENLDGDILFYSETAGAISDYSKVFDFSNLKNGAYNLVVRSGKVKMEQKFEINDGVVAMVNVNDVAAPYFSYNEKKVHLSYINSQEKNLGLYVYDNKHKLLYEESLGRDITVSKRLDFDVIRDGKYEVVFVSGDDIFSYKVEK